MIRLLVLYPKGEGTKFDADYWASKHMPMLSEAWPTMTRWDADKGDDNSPYHAAAHIYFPSLEALTEAMGQPASAKVMADVANYTNVQPQVATHEIIASS